MALTVNAAFSEFMSDRVNLDPDVTRRARASRDWLMDQIASLYEGNDYIPLPYTEQDIYFGSFARRTKIRELDDIDLIACLRAEGASYLDLGTVHITVPDGTRLRSLCHDHTDQLNSRRVVNSFVHALRNVPQYSRSELSRSGEAAVLDLTSYTWSFDVVPGFFTKPEVDGRTYYIIPDGNGYWKKTDPRIDQARVTDVNRRHSGHVLNAIRLLKFWNRRATMPTVMPYLFESIVLSHYERTTATASQFVDLEVAPILISIALSILQPVMDPKGLQGDLNGLSAGDRLAVSRRAQEDAVRATQAREAEAAKDHRESIRRWREVFGPSFPTYG